MVSDTSNAKIQALTADYDAVVAQLSALREDMAKMASSMGAATAKSGQALAQDVTDGVNEAVRYMGRKTQAADVRIEGAVAANPYVALAIAAGVGVLLGALTRR